MSSTNIYFMGFHYSINKDQAAVLEPTDLHDLLPSLAHSLRSAGPESESSLIESESNNHLSCLLNLSQYWNTILVSEGKSCNIFGLTEEREVSLHHQITGTVLWNGSVILADSQKEFYLSSEKFRRDCKNVRSPESICQIVQLESTENKNINIVALTDKNEVGICTIEESSSEITEPEFRLTFLPICKHITSISCGKEHVLMCSKIGVVYSYGAGSRGQLGNGSTENVYKAMVVEALEGLTVLRIAAGGWHSMVLADTADIYTWGWNESGQLGLPSSSSDEESAETCETTDTEIVNIQTIPVVLNTKSEEIDFAGISCGGRHSAAVTDNGKLFTWGWNKYGQLGHGIAQHVVDYPKENSHFSKDNIYVKSVKCGSWCTFVESIQKKS